MLIEKNRVYRYIDPFHAFITPSFGLHSTFDLNCNHLGLFNFKRDDSLGPFLFLEYELIIFTEILARSSFSLKTFARSSNFFDQFRKVMKTQVNFTRSKN